VKPGRLKRFLTAYRTSLKRLSMIGSFVGPKRPGTPVTST
jgi:hypothetical protein